MTATTLAPTGVAATVLSAAALRPGAALTAPGAPDVSYRELAAGVREIAAGLVRLGIEPGDRVAILAGTRPEWTLADLGALWAGATVVPIYHTNSPSECEYILRHAERAGDLLRGRGAARQARPRARCRTSRT